MKMIKRALAALALVAAAVGFASTDAEAQTASSDFEVRVLVNAACTITALPLDFGAYISGQSTPLTGSTTLDVTCPGAVNLPVTVDLVPLSAPVGAFEMTGPGANIPYTMTWDTANPVVLGAPEAYLITDSTPITIDGQIAAGLTPAVGNYAQTVTATLNF